MNHRREAIMRFPGGLVSSAESGHPNRCFGWMGVSAEVGAMCSVLLHAGDTFLDVGAFAGQHSIRAAYAVVSQGRVVAVDPDPRTHQRLQRNIHLLGVADRVELWPAAMSTEDGVGTLHLNRQRSMSSLNAEFHQDTIGKVSI